MICASWLCVSLLWPLFLEESCLAQGWQCCWEIDEHDGLWLGGTLQGRSWLRDEFLSDEYSWLFHICIYIYGLMNIMNMWYAWMNVCCFRYVYEDYVSYYALCFKFFILALYACSTSRGYLPICFVIVASSSSVRGLGTLHHVFKEGWLLQGSSSPTRILYQCLSGMEYYKGLLYIIFIHR